jgi:ubiquinone/menaquinone biosynthesis C-methylase UbiE
VEKMSDMTCDWTAMAPRWDARRDDVESMKAELTARLLDRLAPLAGRQVLELGAGTGELAARLADAVGPDGSVLATDVASGMVELLDKRLAAYPNVTVRELDAAAIDLEPDSVDDVVFRMGLMLVVEPERALTSIRRVLRPGGTFVAAVWGGPFENPWMTTVGMAAMMHGLVQGGPPIGPGGPFSLADPADLEQRVRAAGFRDVTVERIESTRHFASTAEHVATVAALSPGLGDALNAATPDQLDAVRAQVAALTAQYQKPDGVHVPTTALLCVAA